MIQVLSESDADWIENICGFKISLELTDYPEIKTFGFKVPKLGFIVGRARLDTAYLSYFFVCQEHRTRGIGSQLLATFISEAKNLNLKQILVCGETGNAPGYVQPGVKLTEVAAIKLLSRFKFEQIGTAYSMDIDLSSFSWTSSDERSPWKIRIANGQDQDQLYTTVEESVSADWANFFSKSLKDSESLILVAEKLGNIGGFCHSKAGHFGPIGVCRKYRKEGLGTLLTNSTLFAMKNRGLERAWFNWSDEANLKFYQKIGFTIFHKFERFRLKID